MLNHGKLCKTISKYIKKKVIALVWEYIVLNLFFWHSYPRKLSNSAKRTSSAQYIPHTSSITYSTVHYGDASCHLLPKHRSYIFS